MGEWSKGGGGSGGLVSQGLGVKGMGGWVGVVGLKGVGGWDQGFWGQEGRHGQNGSQGVGGQRWGRSSLCR